MTDELRHALALQHLHNVSVRLNMTSDDDEKIYPKPALLNATMPIVPATPMEMLGRAIQMGQTPETLERLLSLQERWERNAARKAYDEAMAAAAAELPAVVKDRTVSHGTGKASYRHESLAAIEKAVRPVLSKHGLHYRWRTGRDGAEVICTCIISGHGHHEENTLAGPADTSGAKNAIQAIGSTVTYLQRYTLKAALGIAAAEDDDGAGGADVDTDISHEQILELERLLKLTGRSVELFCQKFRIGTIGLLPASKYTEAETFLKRYIPDASTHS